jgi:hypothetical protein
MNDCVFKIFLDEEHSYEMRLVCKPENDKFGVSVRIPYDKHGDKLLERLSPVLQWLAEVWEYQWAHGGKKRREACRALQKQATIRQGQHIWLLDGVVPSGIGHIGEAGASRNVSEIRMNFKYSTCTHLFRPTSRFTKVC